MRAFYLEKHGGIEALKWGTLETPTPGYGEVRLRVRACGLNHLDLWVRGGLPGLKLPMPHILGGDITGELELLGPGVESFSLGDRVILSPGRSCGRCLRCLQGQDPLCPQYRIFGEHLWGGNAEFVIAPQVNLVPLPPMLSFEEGAALPIAFLTAWRMVKKARVLPGDRVLVQGGSSGVGVALIQIARLFGAQVYATASSKEKRLWLRDLGVLAAFDSQDPQLAERIKAELGSRMEVVFEHVGTATWEQSLRSLNFAGRLVTCGATTGYKAQVDLRVLFWKQLELLGSTMGSKADFLEMLGAVARGQLRPIIHRVMPLSELKAAHRVIERREQLGKVVLSLD